MDRRALLVALAGLGVSAPRAALEAMRGTQRDTRSALSGGALLRAGAAKIDITPGKPLALEGYEDAAARVSEGVHDRLYARAFAFLSGRSRLVVVSCDVSSFAFGAYFQRAISDRHHLGPDELLLCAVHTHSGPLLTLNPSYPNNLEYTKLLEGMLVTVVGRALQSAGTARMAVARGRSRVGMSRRRLMPDGSVEMAANPEGASDPEVLVLRLARPGGRPFAALFDYACHSRSLRSPNRLISGDVLGIAEQLVEAGSPAGLIGAAFAGASGDQDPVSVVDGFETVDGGQPETVRLATELGQEVLRALESARELPARATIRIASSRVDVPPRTAGLSKWVTVSVAAVGNLVFVGLDCEASVEVGLAIKARSPFPDTFVISNCNGWVGYLPVEHQYAEGGYEVSRSGFAAGAAELVVRETVNLLARVK